MTTTDFHETRVCLTIFIKIILWKLEERFIYQHSVTDNTNSLTDGQTDVCVLCVRLRLTAKEPKIHQLTTINIRDWLLTTVSGHSLC